MSSVLAHVSEFLSVLTGYSCPLCVWALLVLFHSSSCGRLDGFHLLPIASEAVEKVDLQIALGGLALGSLMNTQRQDGYII